jgi:hypothetical protein
MQLTARHIITDTKYYLLGTQTGQVCVIFCLPHKMDFGFGLQDSPESWPKILLAYVEWYLKQKPEADKSTGMYSIKSTQNLEGVPLGAVIPVSEIHQSCMLIPKYENSESEGEWIVGTIVPLHIQARSIPELSYFYPLPY